MSEELIQLDEFQLNDCIFTGSHSQVWEVAPRGGGKTLAMKLLLPEALEDRLNVQTLKYEFKIGKSLEHPNLVRYHKITAKKKCAYFVMEYFRALSLRVQIRGDIWGVQARFRKLVESLLLTLAYIHDNKLVHRDIKPDNILFNKSSEMRLIDFSLTTKMKTRSRKIQGTRTYIAPESILKKPVTQATDMYGLGITLYEALTGAPPFKATTPDELLRKHVLETPIPITTFNKNVTAELNQFVMTMLAKKPAKRFKTMNEAYAQFRNMKLFEEDVEELQKKTQEKERLKQQQSLDEASRLDSRADHERVKVHGTKSKSPKKKRARPIANLDKKESPKPQTTMPGQGIPQQQPQQPVYPPQPMMPSYPQQPYPVMPGQQFFPQQPMYGQPMPGQYPVYPGQMVPIPGQPYPQQPGMPLQVPPGQPPTPVSAPQPPEQAQHPATPPSQPQTQQKPEPHAQTPSPAPTVPTESSDDDLPEMDELPPVI